MKFVYCLSMKHNDCPFPRYLALIRPFVGQVTYFLDALASLDFKLLLRDGVKKSKWKFKMAFAIRGPTPPLPPP